MKITLTIIAAILFSFHSSFAQNTDITINGKIVTENSQEPIEFATVMIADIASKTPITGTTTASDGSFEIKTKRDNFYIEISFIGFQTKTIEDFKFTNGKVELGTVGISENTTSLDEVVVRAEKSQTEFSLDKRVFNVGKDLSSTGMSALEVLNNVPSVQVSIEGEISLRGSSGVQVLINGKPSVLATDQGALGTITADMLEKIEVITNPSAKYDAEGTSGIINIVMKKEEKKGLNGSVTLNGGYPKNYSLGLSMNRRTEKFNLFSQIGFGDRTYPDKIEQINRDLTDNTVLSSEGTHERDEAFFNLILGVDYHINDLNVISLTGNFAYEVEKEFSDNDFIDRNADESIGSSWNRNEDTKATNPKYQYDFQYKKDFKDNKEHNLLFSAQGHFFGKDQSSVYDNTPISGDVNERSQQSRTDYAMADYTFKLDYTDPITDNYTIETGSQYVISDVTNDYAVEDLQGGDWIGNPNLTNIFEYNQKVLGIYGTGAYENDKWGLKLGLRMENTDMETESSDSVETNGRNYTNLFPTIHTSYKLTEFLSFQAGYSKRIFRPRMRDLNPFSNIRNNFVIYTGNPDLMPEYTDSYEITGIYVLEKLSFNIGLYHLFTTDVIERITRFENGISITRPENIGSNRATGLEFNAKYSPSDWLTFNADFNYNYFNRQGTNEATDFDFNSSLWTTRLNTKLKLPAQFELELTGFYESEVQNVQSVSSENFYADMGVRKKLMKGKTILNLSVRDIFASRIRENVTTQPDFYLYNYQSRGRFIVVGISYGFGKGEAMEFSGQKRF